MLVQFLTSTPQPQQVVAAVARLCCPDASIDRLLSQDVGKTNSLLLKMLKPGQNSVAARSQGGAVAVY